MPRLLEALARRRWDGRGVLLHYSDPFLVRSDPLRELSARPGPTLLACGDLNHGPAPIETLEGYLRTPRRRTPHIQSVIGRRCSTTPQGSGALPRSNLFSLPDSHPHPDQPTSLGIAACRKSWPPSPHHPITPSPHRREHVQALIARKSVHFRHATTSSSEKAASLYAQHAHVRNVPLNNDLNHRFFEVMAAGVAQVIVGDRDLIGDLQHLADRPDVFWANSLDELEALVQRLFAIPEALLHIPVAPPTDWPLRSLLERG